MSESATRRAVTIAAAGPRLDRALAGALDGLSRARIKALILAGQVRRGGVAVRAPDARVASGERYTIDIPPPAPARPAAQAIALDIVYEDAELIVVDKPAGLVVHPAPGNPDRTLVNALIAHCGPALTGIGGAARPGIVHRLDKGTSGLIVAAKTQVAHDALVAQFAARTVGREYRALVWGVPAPARGRYDGPIGRDPRNRKKMAVRARGGRAALTHYRVLARYGAAGVASRVACRLATGRTHQIRVHFAAAGHAVIGDPVYGGRAGRRAALPADVRAAVAALDRQALHAASLAFVHPTRRAPLRFESKLPQELETLSNILELL